MRIEDQRRFKVGADARNRLWIACDRCVWNVDVEAPLGLDDLNQRADEHTEVCQ